MLKWHDSELLFQRLTKISWFKNWSHKQGFTGFRIHRDIKYGLWWSQLQKLLQNKSYPPYLIVRTRYCSSILIAHFDRLTLTYFDRLIQNFTGNRTKTYTQGHDMNCEFFSSRIFLPLILKWLPIEIFREHWNWFLKNLLFFWIWNSQMCRSITQSALLPDTRNL